MKRDGSTSAHARSTFIIVTNLIVPGGGWILLGRTWHGLTIGLLFTLGANAAIVSSLLVPDSVPTWLRGLITLLTAALYVASQWRITHAIRRSGLEAGRSRRRDSLGRAREAMLRGDHTAALDAIRPLTDTADRDLLVAYRLAQILAGMGDAPAARAAWRHVRALDRHQIYRAEADHADALLHGPQPDALTTDEASSA